MKLTDRPNFEEFNSAMHSSHMVFNGITYIRADLINELVKALETDTYTPGCNCDECKRIRDALHKVKEDV